MKKVWNKFLEFRKSPTFMLVAFIGLVDLFIFLPNAFLMIIFHDMLPRDIWFLSMIMSFFYGWSRPIVCKYSLAIIPILYFIEFLFKIKIENNLTKNGKKYNTFWLLGIITFVLITVACLTDNFF